MRSRQKIVSIHSDKRGSIINLVEAPITSVLLITSKKGTVRANHYHRRDAHYMYVISGKMRYTSKDLRVKNSRKRSIVLKKGELVFTPPRVAHVVEFLEDTQFLALATKTRKQKIYEADTVRLQLIPQR